MRLLYFSLLAVLSAYMPARAFAMSSQTSSPIDPTKAETPADSLIVSTGAGTLVSLAGDSAAAVGGSNTLIATEADTIVVSDNNTLIVSDAEATVIDNGNKLIVSRAEATVVDISMPGSPVGEKGPTLTPSDTQIEPDSAIRIQNAYLLDALRPDFLSMTKAIEIDTTSQAMIRSMIKPPRINIYQLPYSMTGRSPNWHRMWINTAVLSGAFVSTLFVLECLPEDATSWNRAAIRSVPPFTRWYRNIFVKDPEWDHDKFIFNYVLHPYAGAVYFMSARTQGFNFWQSMLYSFCISTVGWEFGIEAFMERPSYQDLFITPVVGSVIGELFYKLKRNIVSHDYRLAGSPVLGNIVAFLIDPVNEVIDLFRGSETRKLHLGRNGSATKNNGVTSSLLPTMVGGAPGLSFTCTF